MVQDFLTVLIFIAISRFYQLHFFNLLFKDKISLDNRRLFRRHDTERDAGAHCVALHSRSFVSKLTRLRSTRMS